MGGSGVTAVQDSPAKLPLTLRQRQCIEWLSLGLEVDATAEKLKLSPETVKTHLRMAYRELGARNAAHAVRICIERGILQVEPS
jgi:DNA-binding CsgD family transcriptional regulator